MSVSKDGMGSFVGVPVLPGPTLFLAGAGMMTAQLAAGRLLAGHLGQSLYTWTAVIGVFLAGMAVGNVVGGRLADRGRCGIRKALAMSGMTILFMLPLNAAAGWLPWWPWLPLSGRILLHSAMAFLPGAVACGMVGPLVLRAALATAMAGPGRTFGGLHAWGVWGNLAGTFLTGYVLFAHLPVAGIVGLAAILLALPAAWQAPRGGGMADGCLAAPEVTGVADGPAALPSGGWRPEMVRPWLLAALTGAAVMVVELAAGRLLAQSFGQSLYTWTTAIGMVFAGMSLGAWGGGRIVDQPGGGRALPWLLAAASAAVLLTPWGHDRADAWLALAGLGLVVRLALHGGAVFLPPAILLGMILPSLVAAALGERARAGRAVGGIYAAMSAGSIVGTLLAGFLLFARMGTRLTLGATAVLLALAVVAVARRRMAALYVALFLTGLVGGTLAGLPGASWLARRLHLREVAGPRVRHQEESAYSLIAVKEDVDNPRIRRFFMDRLQHSIANLDDPLDLRYHYQRLFAGALAAARPEGQPVRALVVGGGGYTFPRYLEITRPGSQIEVAEIDPAVTRAAIAAFGLPAATTLRIHHRDAGLYVRELARRCQRGEDIPRYDAIFGDSINHLAVPFHLLTVEYLRDVRSLLAPDGIYALILIDALAHGRMVGAAARTCREVFPEVAVFSTHDQPGSRDTMVLVGAATLPDLDGLAERLAEADPAFRGRRLAPGEVADLERRAGGLVLTAGFAPVDDLIRDLVREDTEDLAESCLRRAGRLRRLGRHAEAIDLCRQALAARPGWAAAYNAIGLNHASLGEHALAVMAFHEAVSLQPDSASIAYNLGVSLRLMGDDDGAIDAFAEAVDRDPAYARARYNLASLLHLAGDHEDAAREWQGYLALAPEDGEAHYRHAMSLWRCGLLPEARAALAAARRLGIDPDPGFVKALGEAPADVR